MDRAKPITWDLARFAKFQEALDEAQALGLESFTVDLDRKARDVTFDTEAALDLEASLAAQFAANPTPVFPENREGPEP